MRKWILSCAAKSFLRPRTVRLPRVPRMIPDPEAKAAETKPLPRTPVKRSPRMTVPRVKRIRSSSSRNRVLVRGGPEHDRIVMDDLKWTLKGGRTARPAPFLIAGILNVTPDSFFDGGRYRSLEQFCSRAREMLEEGADFIDLGGESTRPFSHPVGEDEELNRVLPVLREISRTHPEAFLSVDTYRSAVAREALENGACAINDVSACTYDPELVHVL